MRASRDSISQSIRAERAYNRNICLILSTVAHHPLPRGPERPQRQGPQRQIPEELGGVIRPEVVIVFRKNKSSDDVVFIDLSKKYGTEMSPNTFPGLVKRNLVLDKKTISNIIDVLNNRKTVDKFSEIVSLKQLEENDFNLSVSRYVDTYDGEFIRLNDLKSDKKKIDEKMDSLNERIDELMGDLNFR